MAPAFDSRLAVVLLVDDRGWILLQERDEHAPRAANQWGMVGGHVEPDEDFATAVYREVEEETGIVLEDGALTLWQEAEYTYPDGHHGLYQIWTGRVELTDDDIVVGEGRQIVFVDPETVLDLDLAGSSRRFLPEYLTSDLYATLRSAL